MEVFGTVLDAPLRVVENPQVRQRGIAAQQNEIAGVTHVPSP
jgi:hypothetical protein